MIEIILKEFANKATLMPLRAIEFYSQIDWGDPYDANVVIHNFEAESSFKISPVSRNTHHGTVRRLGYNFEATLYLPYNKLGENSFDFIFEELLKGRYSIVLCLGFAKGWSENGYIAPMAINTTYGMKVAISNFSMNHTIEIESVEFRPRVIIRLFGFFKRFNNINFF